ncbi:MAG: sulfatase-like hydrolase/transferase [Myxococcales bacterium]|nr:sulfatase-like hydrolase/transferase [Myxococcales bacterium]
MSALPRALFGGLLLAAMLLGGVEALHLAVADVDLDGAERALAAAYVAAPFTVLGLVVAVTAAGLAGLWQRARRLGGREERGNRSADAGAALLAVVGFVGAMYAVARLWLAQSHDRALGAMALAVSTPALLTGALYFWAATRRQLARLDERLGPRTSQGLTQVMALAGAVLIGLTIGRNEDLRERLGGWTAAFLLAYPALTAGFAVLLGRVALNRPAVRRAVVVVGVLSALGTAELVLHLDARPAVKRALLHETWVFAGAVVLLQPLFDADGDGYAGLLGGGDCDDANPEVNPGAREVARNSVDDDCFGGDSPGAPGAAGEGAAGEGAAGEGAAAGAAAGDDAAGDDAAGRDDAVEAGEAPVFVERPNVVLITVDTLRADHLGFMGYPRPTSPALDALAARGLVFRWVFAQGPQTKASVPSMFIGRYFSEIERSPDLWAQIHPENVTLAERLQALGYHTAGIPSHRFFLPGYGLDQGFAEWDLSIVRQFQRRMPSVVTGHLVSDRAVAWLAARDPAAGPFFLWLHYFDPHHFYQDHDGIDFGGEEIDRYDEEIRYTDEQIGRLLDALKSGPHGARTYVIVHSDHGEGFFEHGYRYHGQHLFNDQVRVPLVIAGPGVAPGSVEAPVALLDVAPTVLELAGAAAAPELRGRSLLAFARGEPPTPAPVFVEMVKDATHSDRRAIIDWPWKLQYGITFDEYTLFDLASDPDEQTDLSASHPGELSRLRARLRQWMSEEVEPVRPRR